MFNFFNIQDKRGWPEAQSLVDAYELEDQLVMLVGLYECLFKVFAKPSLFLYVLLLCSVELVVITMLPLFLSFCQIMFALDFRSVVSRNQYASCIENTGAYSMIKTN